jgi:hypothetical protein
MLDRVVFSCQQNRVNTFYKCIEFQVNSFELLRNASGLVKFFCQSPFLKNYQRYPFETCSLLKEEPITTRQMTLWFVYPELSALGINCRIYINKRNNVFSNHFQGKEDLYLVPWSKIFFISDQAYRVKKSSYCRHSNVSVWVG